MLFDTPNSDPMTLRVVATMVPLQNGAPSSATSMELLARPDSLESGKEGCDKE
jgi:hypothetical protein